MTVKNLISPPPFQFHHLLSLSTSSLRLPSSSPCSSRLHLYSFALTTLPSQALTGTPCVLFPKCKAVKCSQFQTRSHILSLWQDSQNYPKLLGQIAQASIFVVHSAANNLPDDIRPDLDQQITSYFQILLDPCRAVAPFFLCACLCLSR